MIVGISGKQFSGKTSAGEYIVRKTGGKVKRFSFAKKLKEVSCILLGCTLEQLSDQEFKNTYNEHWGMTHGQFLQWFGTDVCRSKNDNIWVDLLMKEIGDCDAVIDDVRFPNEAQAILDAGGVLIRLNGDPSGGARESLRDPSHASETALDDYTFDLVINTDESTKAQTGKAVYDFIKSEFGRNYDLVGGFQTIAKIPKENFLTMFGKSIAECVNKSSDLNKTVLDIIRESLEMENKKDGEVNVMYRFRTGSNNDIKPEEVGGKLVSITLDVSDGEKFINKSAG